MKENISEVPKLPVHEWIAVAFAIFLLFLVTAIIWIKDSTDSSSVDTGTPHYIVDQEIEIKVEGAVEKPGSYKLKRGTTIQEVLALVNPTSEADLTHLKPDKKIRKGQVIKVPQKKVEKKGRKKA